MPLRSSGIAGKTLTTGLMTALVMLPFAAVASPRSFRQDPPMTPVVPGDVQKTLSQAADLSLLGVLAPLKLTSEQNDKLAAALRGISAGDEETRKKDYEAVRGFAADVEKARTSMLGGNALDPELAARLAKANAELASRSDQAHQSAVSKMTTLVKDTLTDAQMATVQERYYQDLKDTGTRLTLPARLKNNKAGTQEFIRDSSVSWFVERVLLNSRTIPLLAALKSSAGTSASSGGGSSDKGSAATPPKP